MSLLEPEADMMVGAEEESAEEETVASKIIRAYNLREPLWMRKKRRANHSLIAGLTSEQRLEYALRLEKIVQKLKSKTVDELADLYKRNQKTSARDTIVNAFHQKRMDELTDLEQQIGDYD
ncbi:hypothetical protein KCU65_g7423, partial [Aureobasidium melanogenum]